MSDLSQGPLRDALELVTTALDCAESAKSKIPSMGHNMRAKSAGPRGRSGVQSDSYYLVRCGVCGASENVRYQDSGLGPTCYLCQRWAYSIFYAATVPGLRSELLTAAARDAAKISSSSAVAGVGAVADFLAQAQGFARTAEAANAGAVRESRRYTRISLIARAVDHRRVDLGEVLHPPFELLPGRYYRIEVEAQPIREPYIGRRSAETALQSVSNGSPS